MKRIFGNENLDAQADRRRRDPLPLKQLARQKAGSPGLPGWRRFGVRLMLSRAKPLR
jgi:hypothetical protein